MPSTFRRAAAACAFAASPAVAQTVLSTDFNDALPAPIDRGVASLTEVQGYAGLGQPGNQFGGRFLRSPTGNTVRITLDGLPPHDRIDVHFLFAAIDSLDGTGTFPEGDFLRVSVDGVQVFRESFANATADQVQSYVPPPGCQLARRVDLGFSGPGGYYTDSAYDFSRDPRFSGIPHSGPSAVIELIMEGPGIQPLDDESWAMDNLRVVVHALCPPDFNRDGFLDFFDYDDYVRCFESGGCPPGTTADFNGDGFADFFDYDDFVSAFEAGC